LATYLTLLLLSKWLTPLGTFGQTLAQLFWGFHFLIGTVYAILMRLIYDYLIQKKWSVTHYPNDYLMQRISGTAFDFMITASISAISITVVRSYFIPVAILSTVGGLITMFYITWISKRLFQQHQIEYTVALYGMLTGTISTGMALLKEVDPQFNSNVAETLVLGSAVGLVFGFPLMLILNIPVLGYLNNNYTFYLYTLAAFALYLLLLWGGLYRAHRRSKKAQ
jgi:ESS family glutamate:Na+ symporter